MGKRLKPATGKADGHPRPPPSPQPDVSAASSVPSCLKAVPGGVDITVRAKPGARRCGVKLGPDAVEVSVMEPAREGEANAAIAEVLAQVLGTRKGAVRQQAGAKSRDKVLRVESLALDQVYSRLAQASELD